MRSRMNKRSAGTLLALLLMLASLTGCARLFVKPVPDPLIEFRGDYLKHIAQWHQERWQELNSESGWLTLVGLFWLKDGVNTCGSDPKMDVVIPNDKIAAHLANFVLTKGNVTFVTLSDGFKVDGKPLAEMMQQP